MHAPRALYDEHALDGLDALALGVCDTYRVRVPLEHDEVLDMRVYEQVMKDSSPERTLALLLQ